MELLCKFSTASYGDRFYTCVVKEASVLKRHRIIKGFIGEHEPGKSNNDVKAIRFEETTVHYFPRGLAEIFPALKKLSIRQCGLRSVTRDDLKGLENLEDLSLCANPLQWLPSNLFVGMTKLKLERISSKILEPIANNRLDLVSFDSNTKINSLFGRQHYRTTKTLRELMEVIDKNCDKPDEDEEMLSEVYEQEDFDRDFVNGFKDLWKTKKFSDFIVVVGSEEFAVHKNVLATQSTIFTEVFTKETKTGKIKIEDFSADVVEGMLEFMYTGEVKDEKLVMDLFAIASKYNVKNLKHITEIQIFRHLNKSNALEVFVMGHLHKSDFLKRRGFAVIQKMFPEEDLQDSMIEKPDEVREIIEVVRKIQEAQTELETKLKKFKRGD
jgi:BTB/POZ domain